MWVAWLLITLTLELSDVLFAEVGQDLIELSFHCNDLVIFLIRLVFTVLVRLVELYRFSLLTKDEVVQDLVFRLIC